MHLLEVSLRNFSLPEDDVALQLRELRVVKVFHPHNPALSGDGAHLYPAPILGVGGGPNKGIVAPPPPFPPFFPTILFLLPPLLCLAITALVFDGGGGAFFSEGVGVLVGGGRGGGSRMVGVVVRLRFPFLPLPGGFAIFGTVEGGGGGLGLKG